ncbi:RsmE family RNA methyltransferase, partial [Actinotalea ferrariae]|uniref:RsmE family RNA methyltransferase n=1 Tax=Actinotalea ferrariae TaxID=1386098 RepID=UPI001C8BC03A
VLPDVVLPDVVLPDVASRDVASPDGGTVAPAEVTVVVGPEGGIADDELAALEAAGATTVRLGPHVLRTSTAGPVALALLADRLGRWG